MTRRQCTIRGHHHEQHNESDCEVNAPGENGRNGNHKAWEIDLRDQVLAADETVGEDLRQACR